jgi:hypothetical protein
VGSGFTSTGGSSAFLVGSDGFGSSFLDSGVGVFDSPILGSTVGFKFPGVSGRTAVVIREEATDATMNETVAIPPNTSAFI